MLSDSMRVCAFAAGDALASTFPPLNSLARGNPSAATYHIYVHSYKDTAESAATQPSVPAKAVNCASLRPFAQSIWGSRIASPKRRYPQEPAVSCTALELSDRHVFGNVRATIFSGDLENRLK